MAGAATEAGRRPEHRQLGKGARRRDASRTTAPQPECPESKIRQRPSRNRALPGQASPWIRPWYPVRSAARKAGRSRFRRLRRPGPARRPRRGRRPCAGPRRPARAGSRGGDPWAGPCTTRASIPVPGEGNKVCPHARTAAGQQRAGQRGARAEILHQQDAGAGAGARQPRDDRFGHPVQVPTGGQLDPEGVLVCPLFHHHRTARGQMQPDHVTCGPRSAPPRAPTSPGPGRGPAAPRPPGSRPPTRPAKWPPPHSRRPGQGTAKD